MYFIVRDGSAINIETQIQRRVLSLIVYLNVHPSTCHAVRPLHYSHMNSLVLKVFRPSRQVIQFHNLIYFSNRSSIHCRWLPSITVP